jgi:hypothetical protein
MSELAQAFKVANSTIYEWINKYPEFNAAVRVNADVFNERVERALAERGATHYIVLPCDRHQGPRQRRKDPIAADRQGPD